MTLFLLFQEWFAKGGDHFVGVIVSPYNPGNSSVSSQVTCLTVSEEISPDRNYSMLPQFYVIVHFIDKRFVHVALHSYFPPCVT